MNHNHPVKLAAKYQTIKIWVKLFYYQKVIPPSKLAHRHVLYSFPAETEYVKLLGNSRIVILTKLAIFIENKTVTGVI